MNSTDSTESDATLRELIAKYQANDPYLIAEICAFRNQSDEVFEWLDRAYAEHNDGVVFTKVDPLLKSLHNDPRYAALLNAGSLITSALGAAVTMARFPRQ